MMLVVELAVGAMAVAGTIMMNSKKKETSSKKNLDDDLDSSKLKYPENDEEGE